VLEPFPGDAAAQTLRQQLRQERPRPILDRHAARQAVRAAW